MTRVHDADLLSSGCLDKTPGYWMPIFTSYLLPRPRSSDASVTVVSSQQSAVGSPSQSVNARPPLGLSAENGGTASWFATSCCHVMASSQC